MYLVIKNNSNDLEENIFQDLNEKYLKIKECLIRCGNKTVECNKSEVENIFYSFLNTKKFFNQ